MYTGCNWIYENHRPEPNHSLQKSDFSHPLLTYHHKQTQGMGSSNSVSSTTYSYHSQEAFPSQSNSMYTSSQPLQNHRLRYPQNSQINSTPMQNYNYNGSGNNQSMRKPQPPRIRVRDVYSLNNNTTHSSMLRSTLLQPQKQQYYPYNSTSVPSTCCSQTQSHCFNQDRVPVPDYNYTYQHYGASPTHISYENNSQQRLHHSAMYQQPNTQNPCNAQRQFNTLHQVKDSSQLSARPNYQTQVNMMPQKEYNHQSVIQGAGINPSVAWKRNTSEIPAQAEQRQYCKENRPVMSAVQISREASNVPDSGGRRQELAYVPLLSPISPCGDLTPPPRLSRADQEANRMANSQTGQRGSCVESRQTMICLSAAQITSRDARNCIEKSNNQSHNLSESGKLCQEQNSLIPTSGRCNGHGAVDSLTSKQTKDVSLPPRNSSNNPSTDDEEDALKKSVSECLARLKQEKVETVEVEKNVQEDGISRGSEIKKEIEREVECSQAEAEPKGGVEEAAEIENVGEEDEGTEEAEEEQEETQEVVEIKEKKEVELIQGEQKYRSEIDRKKLNMLIQFVEKEEKEEENSVRLERIGEEKKNRRRKLRKEFVIRNKNCEKEFIAVKSVKNVRKCVEDLSQCNDIEVGQKLSTEEKREDVVECKDKKDSVRDNGEMLEERKIVNIMKAFQSLGHHFCANCNFIAPIEAIWINVVSGELRCVHCFRKMVLNTDKSFEKTKKCYASKETQSDPVESSESKNILEDKTKREPGKEDAGDGSGGKYSSVKVEVSVKKEERVGGRSEDEKDRESSVSDELELEKKEILGHVLGKQRKGVAEGGKKRRMSLEELMQEKAKRMKESGKEVKERKAGSEERCVGKSERRSCDKSVTGEKAEGKEEKAKRGGSETEVSRKQKERSWERDKEDSGKKRVKRSSEQKEGTGEEKRSDKGCSNVITQKEVMYESLGNLTKRTPGVKGSELREDKEEWKRRKEKESESPKKSSEWKHEKSKTEKSERKEKHHSKKSNTENKERFHSHRKLSDGHHHHKEKHSEHRRTENGRKERKEKAMEYLFGEKKEAKMVGKTIPKRLQEKLERRTKKLSWSLLDQT